MRRAVGILAVLAAGLAVFVMVRSVWLLEMDIHLRDDAYYYLSWARNLAWGEGPCVTQDVWTSGVHVLWPLLLTPLFWVVSTESVPAVSVGLGIAMHLTTAWLLFRLAGSHRALGVLVAALFAGSPYLAGEILHGQTALACLTLVLFLTYHGRGPKTFFALGLIAVAARSDLIFFVATTAMIQPRERARRIVLTAIILFWYFGWNLLLGGGPLQDSARPIPWLLNEGFVHEGGVWSERFWQYLKPILLGTPFRLTSTALALAWLVAIVFEWRRRERYFACWLVGALGVVVLHNLIRYYPRDYYFAPFAVVSALALMRVSTMQLRIGALLAVLALAWNGKHAMDGLRTYPAQREMALAARVLGIYRGAGAEIGCFNAGLMTWHYNGNVINLDGVVNRPAFEALRAGKLLDYLADWECDLIIDNPVQFQRTGVHANGRHFGAGFDAERDLEEAFRVLWPDAPPRERDGIGSFRLYRIGEAGSSRPRRKPQDFGPTPGGRAVGWHGRPGQVLSLGDWSFTADADAFYVLVVPALEARQLFVDGKPLLRLGK